MSQKQVKVTTSWDDGHVLDMKLAVLLKKYDIKGTFYISPQDREFSKDERLTPAQIKQLSKDFEIGAHTMTHPRLTTITPGDAQQEIRRSKIYLEELTGRAVISFCYPGGDYSSQHIPMVKKAGFKYARTVQRFQTITSSGKPYEVPTTIHTYRHWSDALRILRVARYRPVLFAHLLLNWDALAIRLFEQAREQEGVFHLWGHSWEVDANNDWPRLERVLRYISDQADVDYATNGELVPV
jgi:peptidoglycan/xylan/chitin deacetylase (PgdA/CDA1 family)